jgi:hypothetical protein
MVEEKEKVYKKHIYLVRYHIFHLEYVVRGSGQATSTQINYQIHLLHDPQSSYAHRTNVQHHEFILVVTLDKTDVYYETNVIRTLQLRSLN